MSQKIKKFKENSAIEESTGSLFPPEKILEKGERSGPLADRMRPETLDDFLGQEELMSEGAILRRMIEDDKLSSVIFWGPPGSGKTTLARLIAKRTDSLFLSYSAVTSGSKEMKEVMSEARRIRRSTGMKTILFIDEVHRFNKAQQDAFLPFVERGDVILVGATTENPSFEVIAALLSRSKVFLFSPLSDEHIAMLLERVLKEDDELSDLDLTVTTEAVDQIIAFADGDARRALTALELCALLAEVDDKGRRTVGPDQVSSALQKKALAYDRVGEEHYNIISALHKSIRGSDPDASLYWLARMLEGGEDRRYVLRRLIRAACEDIGMADPSALQQAVSAFAAFDILGVPEGDLVLAQLVVYLAMAPKSNSVYRAYGKAVRDVREEPARPAPLHIRNAPTGLMKDLGYGKGYEYSHDMPEGLSGHSFFPDEMKERRYYSPTGSGNEEKISARLAEIREQIKRMREKKSAHRKGKREDES
jgi:putative ATPase